MPSDRAPDLRPYFDATWYVAAHGRGRRLVRLRPWAYYRRRGRKKGHSPRQLFAAEWYRDRHTDVVAAGLDALAHYVSHGWREGRSPHPVFDVSWYLDRNPDVAAAGREPLLHYLTQGWREGRSPHPAFDARAYLADNPDVAAAGVEPLGHYLEFGWREGRRPHPLFDGRWYLERYPDVALAGLEPLTHFLTTGWRERREATPALSLSAFIAARERPLDAEVNPLVHFIVSEFEPVAADPAAVAALLARHRGGSRVARGPAVTGPENRGHVRAIAMYLPQFHRVPENDLWWGEGFTEWSNVRRGRPMFAGHHQPHVPHPDVGYYDLDDETVLERQAEMARRHGIHGFCFYHYWFDGRRILEKPVERLLRSGKPDFPFCLCWANENWTRTWDGLEREVLLEQRHSAESDERFIRDLLPALRDPRYIRVDGKPLLAVYRPGLLTDPAATAARWRAICESEGLPGIHLAAFHSFDRADPREYGFDSAVQFPPLQIPTSNLARGGVAGLASEFRGGILDYRAAVAHSLARPAADYPLYRGVMPSWDNTPRRMERATAWINSSPELYGRWLRAAIDQMQREQPPERQLLFINAWNEWAEGAHLEPDTRHGYRYLEETAAALVPQQRTAVAAAADHADPPEAVRQLHWNRLRSLFGAPPPAESHAFLADHVALLARLAAAGHRLDCAGGRPVCHVAGRIVPLDDRAALATAHELAFPAAADAPFCFVVLQFNNPDVTARCVDSLRRLGRADRPVHVVVVDNGSAQPAVARTRELFAGMDDVSLVFTGENLGFARGNNVGYRHAREQLGAGFIAVINNDTVVGDPDFVNGCRDLFAATACSVLGPDIVTPDGRHENPWNDEVYDESGWESLRTLFERQRATWLDTGRAEFRRIGRRTPHAERIFNPILQGAAYIFTPAFTGDRSAAFDERTFLYGEEFLLAVDCLVAGHAMVYSSALAIAHEEGVSTAKLPERRKLEMGYAAVIDATTICRDRLRRLDAAARGVWLEPDAPEIAALTGDGRTHVLVDLLFCQPGFHGGGEYGKAVFKALVASAVARGDVQVWVALDPAQFIDEWVWQTCRDHAVNIVSVKTYDDIVRLVNAGLFSSFFAPAIVVYTGYEYLKRVGGRLKFAAGRTRVVGTLLDVRDLELAEAWDRIAQARRTAGCDRERRMSPRQWEAEAMRQRRHADELRGMYHGICTSPALAALVTISEYTAASIARRVGIDEPLHVCYAPEKDRPRPEAFAWAGVDLASDPFAVVLNAAREEKNAASIVAAFDRLFGQPDFAGTHPGLKLLLVGLNKLSDLGVARPVHAERFVCLPHLPAGRLEYLLSRAAFVAYASFNEGFGYPPLEAMTHGTPSLIAANTSVPEVCGAAAEVCDPFDIDSIAAGIRGILDAPPAAVELERQAATVGRRQRHDLGMLVDLICGRAAAVETAAPARAA